MSSLNVGQVNATTVNATNTLNVTNGIVLPSYTTATRPASPSAGQMIYNTTTVDVEVWTGSAWKPFLGQGLRNWTDATRPSSPQVGDIGYNTEQEIVEVYDGKSVGITVGVEDIVVVKGSDVEVVVVDEEEVVVVDEDEVVVGICVIKLKL